MRTDRKRAFAFLAYLFLPLPWGSKENRLPFFDLQTLFRLLARLHLLLYAKLIASLDISRL